MILLPARASSCRQAGGSATRNIVRRAYGRTGGGTADCGGRGVRRKLSLLTSSACAAGLPLLYHRGFSTGHAPATMAAATQSVNNPLPGVKITVYQYRICPFCCKVKAVLDYWKIPYETVEVNPLTKAEIKFSADYRKVPIARVQDDVVKDSNVIVDRVTELLKGGAKGASDANVNEVQRFFSPEAKRWAEFADTKLAVLLFPNITRSYSESYQAFSYVHDVPHFSAVDKWSNQVVGATAMWAAQGKLKKKYGIDDERTALFEAVKTWVEEVGEKPFVGGSKPNLGDLAVYGAIRAIAGLDAHRDLLQNTAIQPWYERVEQAIGESSCVQAQ